MTFLSRLKRLDVYRDVPNDLTEQTMSGGVVSLICSLLIVFLFVTELMEFLTVKVSSETYVDAPIDTSSQHKMIKFHMNITMHRLPCALVSVDVQDIMGTHVVDIGGEVHKTRVSNAGEDVLTADGQRAPFEGDGVEVAEQKGEGCRITGYMSVKMVPGNFHISCHAHGDLLGVFYGGEDEMMNVSHTIHHLSFGDRLALNQAKGTNPLNGESRWGIPKPGGDTDDPITYEYFIKIVPTTFQYVDGREEQSFQFTANSNQIDGHYRIPAVYFRYEFSAITQKFRFYRTQFSHFIVEVCAIIGGIFTVMGWLNHAVKISLRQFQKRQIGKLG